MKISKNWFAAAVLGVALVASAPAQDAAEGHGKGHQKRMAHLQETLKLTPEQQAKVQPILEAQREKMRALRSEAQTGDRAALREKMRAIHQETTEQLKAVLTPEQMTTWTNMRFERGRGHKGQSNNNQNNN